MNERGSDTCFCGDYRSQHGPLGCRICACEGFKFSHCADAEERAHWEKYHGKKSGKRAEQ